MTVTPKIGYSVARSTKRTLGNHTNQRGKGQAHRGWKGIVRVPGEREPIPCGCWHQSAKGARACARRTAIRLGKERGIEVMTY